MATEITVNSEEVVKNLDIFTNTTLRNNLEKAILQACYAVEADAKEKCPVQYGILRQSIQSSVETDGDIIEGFVGTNIDYAPYVHQGTGIYAINGNGRKEVPWKYKDLKGNWHSTSGIKPTPFLQDAVDKNKADIINYFRGILKDG